MTFESPPELMSYSRQVIDLPFFYGQCCILTSEIKNNIHVEKVATFIPASTCPAQAISANTDSQDG